VLRVFTAYAPRGWTPAGRPLPAWRRAAGQAVSHRRPVVHRAARGRDSDVAQSSL